MTGRLPDGGFWRGRSVVLTGHTGLKGSWLARWLAGMGADVHGIALDPPTRPSMFEAARVADILASDHRHDVRDQDVVHRVVAEAGPSVILHLAAQPLVRDGYRRPSETIATNALGTVNVLEAARSVPSVESIVVVTTDKVYEPSDTRGEASAHREEDRLGGVDPYAVSKVMAEFAVQGFRALPAIDGGPAWSTPLATARAGNVIGGGDWSAERLVPDGIRAFASGEALRLRFPQAVRPWQHVLEPLCGYLVLAESLVTAADGRFSRAFNFGPDPADECTVGDLARSLAVLWGTGAAVVDVSDPGAPYENPVLRLDSGLARAELGWSPRWNLERTLEQTVAWYRGVLGGGDAAETTDQQIEEYVGAGRS